MYWFFFNIHLVFIFFISVKQHKQDMTQINIWGWWNALTLMRKIPTIFPFKMFQNVMLTFTQSFLTRTLRSTVGRIVKPKKLFRRPSPRMSWKKMLSLLLHTYSIQNESSILKVSDGQWPRLSDIWTPHKKKFVLLCCFDVWNYIK